MRLPLSITAATAALTLAACATAPGGAAPGGMDPSASLAPPHAPIVEGRPVPVVPHPDQLALLESDDPQLAAHKRVAFDLWRSVVNAGHVEAADMYLTEDYLQHNPNAPTGREAFKAFFTGLVPRQDEVPDLIQNPLVTIVADGDYVAMAFVDEREEPDGSGAYTTTWFDMFRFEGDRIAEHWDSVVRSEAFEVPSVEDGGPLPVTGVEGDAQIALLQSDDPTLFANKRLVFDLWRHTVDGGREQVAELYLDPIYIQHNPNAATGRQGFKDYMAQRDDLPIETHYLNPLVAILAEKDLVVQAVADERPVPGGAPGETYTLAHFDMFRIENGRIVEHWDSSGRGELPSRLEEQD